mmetsp:Transcript_3763/g.7803  ORF Transcript_3763/g.7803 Transcript_3763/m.7803 type:complete len:390 (-) Transcript_3763:151-1320(-)
MFLPAQSNPTGHRASQHLVATDGNAINRLLKRNLRSPIDEGHHHGKQCSITMNVVPLPRNPQSLENPQNPVQIIYRSLHRRSNVDIDNHRAIPILGNLRSQRIVVDLSHGQGRNSLGVHPVIPGCLKHAVMRLPRTIQNPIRVTLPRQQNAVQVPLRPARGDVPPILPLLHLPQLGEKFNDRALELPGMHPIIRSNERVPQVIDRILHKLIELLVIIHQIVRIPKVHAALPLEQLIVTLQNVRLVGQRRPLVGSVVVGGDAHHFGREEGFLCGGEGVDDALAGAPGVEDGPGGGRAGFGGVVFDGVGGVVVEVGFVLVFVFVFAIVGGEGGAGVGTGGRGGGRVFVFGEGHGRLEAAGQSESGGGIGRCRGHFAVIAADHCALRAGRRR